MSLNVPPPYGVYIHPQYASDLVSYTLQGKKLNEIPSISEIDKLNAIGRDIVNKSVVYSVATNGTVKIALQSELDDLKEKWQTQYNVVMGIVGTAIPTTQSTTATPIVHSATTMVPPPQPAQTPQPLEAL